MHWGTLKDLPQTLGRGKGELLSSYSPRIGGWGAKFSKVNYYLKSQ
jgi:hypothetical protein